MSLASKRIAVTLCCAQEDASHLRPLVIHLEQQGYEVRLIEGVGEDPYLLGSSLDRQLGACVIVACLSDALGPAQFRRIEGVYNARKGPDHWLETIFVEPDETLAMAEGVRAAVARVKERRPEPKARKTKGASPMRDVVGVTNLTAVGTDKHPSDSATAGARPPPADTLGLGETSPVAGDEDPESSEPEPGTSQSMASQSQSMASQSQSMASQSMASQSMASQSMATESMIAAAAAAERRTPGWVAPVLFLILLAVAGTVVLVLLQEQEDQSGRGRGAPSLPAASAGDDPTPAPNPTAGAETGATGAETGATETGETDNATPGSDDEAARIVEAIKSGDMRAIDLILIANTSELCAWRDASNRCRSKSVNGVRGWRLPTLDELETIRKARLVAKGDRYWSSTLATQVGTGKDHVYVLDLDNRTIEPVSKQASEVRVLCVRPALSADE